MNAALCRNPEEHMDIKNNKTRQRRQSAKNYPNLIALSNQDGRIVLKLKQISACAHLSIHGIASRVLELGWKKYHWKDVGSCLKFTSQIKLPQREALMNIWPINAAIWSNLTVLYPLIEWALLKESAWSSWKVFSFCSIGHLKLPQQIALTEYNRQVSAIAKVLIVTAAWMSIAQGSQHGVPEVFSFAA